MVGEERAFVESKIEIVENLLWRLNIPSQNKLEKILKELQTNQVESPNIDGKAVLNLKELGDRATLISTISAIANTGQEGYLVIGIEDKTWRLLGNLRIPQLKDADKTQKQINQILAERVDPAIKYKL